jgi:nitrite reductase/ring-hydroxylating ferredoxin subunit
VIRVAAGPAALIAAGRVRVVQLPRAAKGPPREALLLRDHAGTLRAYLNRCEHLPVPLDAGGRKFLSADGAYLQCQTHGARYRLVDGYCVVGPCAGRALEALAIEIDDADVYILIDA